MPAGSGRSTGAPPRRRSIRRMTKASRSISDRDIAVRKNPGEPVNVLTHCNAGWLATVDWGTATSAIYQAHDKGIAVHVWVDETRPRNQGSALTTWELGSHRVAHTVIPPNTGGRWMQHGAGHIAIV